MENCQKNTVSGGNSPGTFLKHTIPQQTLSGTAVASGTMERTIKEVGVSANHNYFRQLGFLLWIGR